MSTTNSRRRERLRGAGLILGIIEAVVLGIFGLSLGSLAEALSASMTLTYWLIVLAPVLFVSGSLFVASKWPLIGGVLFIVFGLLPTIALIGIFGTSILLLFVSLLLLAPGVLFLLSWREGRKDAKEAGN